jgi:hypothetical protein
LADSRSPGSITPLHESRTGSPKKARATPLPVTFDRRELSLILTLYGRKVAQGEWRDYAMDFLKDKALFSIHKRTSEIPLYVIEKNPALQRKQGQYLITNMTGRVLKRGHDLAQVLKVLDHDLVVVK